MSTLIYLCCLIGFPGIAAAVIAVLTRLIEHRRDADLKDRFSPWAPGKGP